MQSPICIHSEVGKLKKVLVHRPGMELENLIPEYLSHLLFDDIPYLNVAREEHDFFTQTLRECGAEVIYLKDLLTEAVEAAGAKEQLVEDYIREAHVYGLNARQALREYLTSLSVPDLFDAMSMGMRKSLLHLKQRVHLADFTHEDFPFYAEPMPNLYFTRDPFSCIDSGVLLSRMANEIRQRETLFADYIFRYHPVYKNVPHWHERSGEWPIEGGDCLVLNRHTMAIGMSERTSPQAIEEAAEHLLTPEAGFKRVLAIDLPKFRTFMHLDTVMTMVDKNIFVVHPNIQRSIRSFLITRRGDGRLYIRESGKPIDEALQEAMELDSIHLIRCGGASTIDAAREQWNDGANTLAVAPGEVITYSRNYVTNTILRDRGITVHEIPSSELSRGRGGPRCMSMPLQREEL